MKNGFIKAGHLYLCLFADFQYYKAFYDECKLMKSDMLDLAEKTRKKMKVLRIVLKEIYRLNGIKIESNKELRKLLLRDVRRGTVHMVKIAKIKETYKILKKITITY